MLAPKTEEDVAEIIAGATGPLRLVGGGTRPVGKPVSGAALALAGLSGISLYEPGALTIVAQAGTPLAEVEAALEAENQLLPFEPVDYRAMLGTSGTPTIGGAVAAGVAGPRRMQAGGCRDSLIGLRFVDGAGTVLKNGGRVMKNVTGYDLVKLMAGSFGTLGVLTEVAFKVLPRPDASATLILHDLTIERAVAAMSAALGSPYEVTGAAHLTHTAGDSPDTMLRIEGFEGSVRYRMDQLKALLAPFGDMTTVTDPAASQKAWIGVGALDVFADLEGDLWRLSVKPGDAPAIAERLPEGAHLQLDWGGGLIWVICASGTDLRSAIGPFNGHATLMRASAETRAALPVFHPENPVVDRLSQGLREKFDPRGILNLGVMG